MEKTIINSLPQGTILHGMTYDYQILKALGQGAFGITYLTEVKLRGELGTVNATVYVAIKEFFMHEINGRDNTFVTSSNKEGLYDKYKKKFIGEAKNLNKLKHDNIIKVIEAFEANNTVYYSMEFIDGGSLDDLITRRGFLTEEETISYTKQIASALSFMHSRNMLHLDIKPSNIMLRDGSAVLIDFGLSKQFDDDGNPESSTTIGGGTPGYAPLEQANFHGDTSNGLPMTMDIYALGATMFKMFTGHRPPVASDIMNDGFPAHELKERGVADDVIELVGEAMSARHKKRIPDAKMLLERLRKIQNFQDEDIVLKESPQRLGGGLLSILEAIKEKKERNQSEPEVTVIDYKERIYLKGVKKILFSYCEGLTSIPSDSFQVEITEQSLTISKGIHPLSGVYGGITRRDFTLPFSKNQMQSLISKLNTLHLYKYHGETIEGEPGGFHMRLLINTEDPNGVVDVYHEGNVIRQLGTLRGDVNLLLDEIKKMATI